MKKLMLAFAALAAVLGAKAEPTITVTTCNVRARRVALAFTGVEEPLTLVAFKNVADKGDDLTQWASATVLGTVPAGTTEQQLTLPEGYDFDSQAVRIALMSVVPVEWIENGSDAYIDLDYKPYASHRVDMDFETPSEYSSLALFDAREKSERQVGGSSIKPRYSAWAYGPTHDSHAQQLRIDGYNQSLYSSDKLFDVRCSYNLYVQLSESYARLNDVEVTFPSKFNANISRQGQSQRTLILFAYRSQTDDSVTFSTSWRLKSFKLIGNGGYESPIINAIPCVKAGEAQLYDFAKEIYYTNAGAGKFTASENVVVSNCVEEFVSCVSDQLASTVVKSLNVSTGSVELSFPACDAKRLLYVAKSDSNTSEAVWSCYCLLGEIEAGATTYAGKLPSDYIQEGGFIRFFLSEWEDESTRRVNPRKAAWAQGGGNCCLDLGIKPDSTNVIEMAFELTSLDETVNLFDARSANAKEARYTAMVYGKSSADHQNQLRLDMKDSSTTDDRFSTQKFETDHPYFLRANGCGKTLLNGEDTGIASIGTSFTAMRTLLVMGRRSEDATGTITRSPCRLSSFDVLWSEANPARRCSVVPAIDANGSVKFYDCVNNTEIEKSGDGSFIAGPDAGTGVIPVNDGIEGQVYGVSNPIPSGSSVKKLGLIIVIE